MAYEGIFLADALIAESIAFGISAAEIAMDSVVQAARIAQVDQLIRYELPFGYETTVGECGIRLSDGQCQPIGIARVLYRNVEVTTFDEAASTLDNPTEREVMGAIDAPSGNKTIVIIAHELSTISNFDRFVVMDQG